jgi:hypothetical protein
MRMGQLRKLGPDLQLVAVACGVRFFGFKLGLAVHVAAALRAQ